MRVLPVDVVFSLFVGLVGALVAGVFALLMPGRSKGWVIMAAVSVGVLVGMVALAATGYENTGAP